MEWEGVGNPLRYVVILNEVGGVEVVVDVHKSIVQRVQTPPMRLKGPQVLLMLRSVVALQLFGHLAPDLGLRLASDLLLLLRAQHIEPGRKEPVFLLLAQLGPDPVVVGLHLLGRHQLDLPGLRLARHLLHDRLLLVAPRVFEGLGADGVHLGRVHQRAELLSLERVEHSLDFRHDCLGLLVRDLLAQLRVAMDPLVHGLTELRESLVLYLLAFAGLDRIRPVLALSGGEGLEGLVLDPLLHDAQGLSTVTILLELLGDLALGLSLELVLDRLAVDFPAQVLGQLRGLVLHDPLAQLGVAAHLLADGRAHLVQSLLFLLLALALLDLCGPVLALEERDGLEGLLLDLLLLEAHGFVPVPHVLELTPDFAVRLRAEIPLDGLDVDVLAKGVGKLGGLFFQSPSP
mmetsp:Transcript_39114/g.75069  ORF Transcript_39114/g.75069 Transcript_39114/m.75069 type:complete len:403 (-) Transcript_39114:1344-2552(-)